MPSLASHPIFRIDDDAFSSLKGTGCNVLAFKGTQVYVAVGSTVRFAELREWFAMDTEPQDEKQYYQV